MSAIDTPTIDFGTRMRRVRETNGVSLREIADSTKISVRALEALERNDISRLPGGIFSRAFVRAYALAIGADPEQTVQEFLSQFPHESVRDGSPHYRVKDDRPIDPGRQRARAVVIALAIVLPLLVIAMYIAFIHPVVFSRAEAAPHATAEQLPVIPSTLAEPLTFEVMAKAPVTLQVALDGVRREARAAAAGERFVFSAQREMTLTMSDAGAIQLSINNQPTVSLGRAGEARTVQIDRRNFGAFLASQ